MESGVASFTEAGHSEATRRNTIVVGAGPAGLALGACLKRAGIPCLILEQDNAVGATWRGHYDRLHLHTDKMHSALPFAPFPTDYPRYPSRLQLIEYLEAYARTFQLAPSFGQRVTSARHESGCWRIQTQETCYHASNLVVAAGCNREPNIPSWPGQADFRGAVLHASRYRNGVPFKGQAVLVIGFGNSGGEIAIDLHEHGARPSLAVRSPVNVIPRELFGIPILAIALAQRRLPPRWADALNAPILRAVMGDLARLGLRKSSRGPMQQIRHDGRAPLIDVGTIDLIKRGDIRICPAVERFTETGVVFDDGSQRRFAAVILATGYRARVDAFLEGASAAQDPQGTPLSSGCASPIPGLYFCGYHIASTGMLREIGLEAVRIAASIARIM
ncbi:MAG: NAD(P)/FAD-dependent oxidoreductase [Dokdonella sp.]